MKEVMTGFGQSAPTSQVSSLMSPEQLQNIHNKWETDTLFTMSG